MRCQRLQTAFRTVKHIKTSTKVEEEDITLASLTKAAKNKALNILVGSLALKHNKSGHKLINRSFFIDSSGKILAKYDKLHMFDACVSDQKNIMKARDLRQGKKRKSFQLPSENWVKHMLRYQISHLYRDLSKRGAQILTVPSAFTVPTGKAHWEILCAHAR